MLSAALFMCSMYRSTSKPEEQHALSGYSGYSVTIYLPVIDGMF